MRLATILSLLLVGLPVTAQQADDVRDPQTFEPVPSAAGDEVPLPSGGDPDRSHNLELLVHLPEGSTRAVRFLTGDPFAVLAQNGAAVVSFTWGLPTSGDQREGNAVELDRVVFEHQPSDIFVTPAKMAFVALRGGGVHLVDAILATQLFHRGQTDSFDALAVTAAGGILYAGAGFQGLRIYDASNPDLPKLITTLPTNGSANGLDVQGNLLLVANGNPAAVDNFLIYDVSDPANPTLVGGYNPDGFATNVQAAGDVAYVSGAFGVIALDISNPANPTLLDSFDAGGETAFDLAYRPGPDPEDSRLAVAGLAGVFVLDASDPANLTLVDSSPAQQGMGVDIAFIQDYDLLVLGDRFVGASVKNFHEGNYGEVAFYRNGGFSHKAAFQGERLYVTDLAGALRVINASDVYGGMAFQSARLPVPSNTSSVLPDGNVAYVTDADFGPSGLTVVDITTPSQPSVVTTLAFDSQMFGLDKQGDVLFVASGFGGLTAVNVADPTQPQVLGSLGFGSNIFDVAVRDDVAYLASFGGGMIAVDVSDPSNMSVISQQSGWGFLTAVAFQHEQFGQSLAYAADAQHGLRTVDISDPANMTSTTTPPSVPARDVAGGIAITGNGNMSAAYLADDFFGLRLYYDGEQQASFVTADRGIGVAVKSENGQADLVAVASGETGIYILRGPYPVSAEDDPFAAGVALDSPYPNPARDRAKVAYRLAEPGEATLDVYDLLGRRAVRLAEGMHAAGMHETRLDVSALAAGMYVVRLTAGEQQVSRRMVVVR